MMRFLRIALGGMILLPALAWAGNVEVCSVAPNTEYPMTSDGKPWCEDHGESLRAKQSIAVSTATPADFEVVIATTGIPPIHFQKAKFNLTLSNLEMLKKTLDTYKSDPNLRHVRLKVTGHTDSDPIIGSLRKTIADNWALSRSRALTVAKALSRELKMPLADMQIDGKADTVPLASNATTEGRAMNRRVEIEISYERAVKPVPPASDKEEPARPAQVACQPTTGSAPYKGYRISVDGVPLDQNGLTGPESQRCNDVAMNTASISVQADGLKLDPVLNISAWPDGASISVPVIFTMYSNYSTWIEKAEVRLFKEDQAASAVPLEVLPIDEHGQATWTPRADEQPGMRYVLRIYDSHHRFDETEPKDLKLFADTSRMKDEAGAKKENLIVYGKSHLALHNIPLRGATLTVHGEKVLAGSEVLVMGRPVPVDDQGKFVTQEIVAPGVHDVSVIIHVPENQEDNELAAKDLEFHRSVYVADQDWFYIALADLTVGKNGVTGPAALVTADNDHYDDKIYTDGHLAFYLKGKIQGQYLLTASADTQEQPVKNLFTDFASKDPEYVLRRIDPNKYYPVYGDDSVMQEDAPTQGKFYVRLERGESNVLWGNYTTRMNRNTLAQVDRALYGAKAHLAEGGTTSFGQKRTQIDAFSAKPDTVFAREEMRGTGGSLYYLQHQDITVGSEQIRVEVRDKDSQIVLRTNNLTPSQDYDIDPIQGRIMLHQPLPGITDDSALVRSGDLPGNPVFLVMRYEYAPLFTSLDNIAEGASVSQWVGDHLQIGGTVSRERQTLSPNQDLLGVDATLRKSAATYVRAEAAQTEGAGSGAVQSTDGGFQYSTIDQDTTVTKAQALRIESAFASNDLGLGALKTTGNGYYQTRDAGFAAPGQLTTLKTEQWGGTLAQPLWTGAQLNGKYDETKEIFGQHRQSLDANLAQKLGAHWTATGGSRSIWNSSVVSSTPSLSTDPGKRLDLAGQLTYDSLHDWKLYGFGQGTLDRDPTIPENNRAGGGVNYKITNHLTLGGEGSGGGQGAGGKLTSDYRINDRSDLYLNYQLESNGDGEGSSVRTGSLVSGGRTRYSDAITVFGEERWMMGGGPQGITHSYGTDYAPTDHWQFGLNGEHGTLTYPGTSDINRTAGTISAGYHNGRSKYVSAIEARSDITNGNRLNTYFFKNDLGYQMNPNWRTLAKFNYAMSDSSQGDFYQADFTEGVFGFAYRPTRNDRFNMLTKYTYYNNLASPGQLGPTEAVPDFRQRSHIVDTDLNYDLFRPLTIGGKYGLRFSQLQDSRTGGPWFDSTTQLIIVRLDIHIVKEWDFLTEGRTLWVIQARDANTGALVGLYRHLGNNLKLGGGYNFTNYSDDLTDLSYKSHGWFVNVLAEF